jgi:LytS/YehU family sensor histidine kinase
VLCVAVTVAICFFFLTRGRDQRRLRQIATAQRDASEAQLKLLESQLEPHMLFNTLANLRVLIAIDPPRAQAMLDQLIAFLRATLERLAAAVPCALGRVRAALRLPAADAGADGRPAADAARAAA